MAGLLNNQHGAACCDQRCGLAFEQQAGERKTWWVILLTLVTMAGEVAGGIWFGSMALLADGWHMASHAVGLGITALAYYLARRNANNPRYAFGTGKMGDLAGYTSAFLLMGVALLMLVESVKRFVQPVSIHFEEALLVAGIGLLVNVLSVWLLNDKSQGVGRHGHQADGRSHSPHHRHGQGDHNLKAAYLHVLTDALTSVLAIIALVAGRFWNWVWMDPLIGVVGGLLVARWAWGLLRLTGGALLDATADDELVIRVENALRRAGARGIEDLHVWRVGPGNFCVVAALTADKGGDPAPYRRCLADLPEIKHATVEVRPRLS